MSKSRKPLKLCGNQFSLFSGQFPDIRGVVVNPLACLTVLSLGCVLDLFVDSVDQPTSVSDWELVVVSPVHSKVVTKQEERFKDYFGFVFRS